MHDIYLYSKIELLRNLDKKLNLLLPTCQNALNLFEEVFVEEDVYQRIGNRTEMIIV